jgi:hypothetical protein
LLVEAFDKMLRHDRKIRLQSSPNRMNPWICLICPQSGMRWRLHN